jgi:hypothetical protein
MERFQLLKLKIKEQKKKIERFKLMESKSYADSSDDDIFAHISYST